LAVRYAQNSGIAPAPERVRRLDQPAESTITSARIPAVAFQNVVGSSPSLRRAIHLGCKVANHTGTNVLLHGETGTGKELFARGIHYSGPNAGDPFVAINCSAIPEHLLESELFGHEKGAFTGADTLKKGLLEFAGDGTVFLDEIGELPASLQPKLLRVLEERKVRRVGGLREIEIGCRVIAATNRDLQEFVRDGLFRADLYYRLSIFRLELPPLRERLGDIDLLARFFLDTLCRDHEVRPKQLSSAVQSLLRAYTWPGNVRELKNTMEGALIVCDGDLVQPEHLPRNLQTKAPVTVVAEAPPADVNAIHIPDSGLRLEEAEKQLLEATLRLAQYNQSLAARMLGVSRPTVIRMMEKHGLRTRRSLETD
jgi:two-component system, NtrC family, response regulator AtoC